MVRKKIFISFDYDNDKDIRGSLKNQLSNMNSTFDFLDMSINRPIDEKWKEKARSRIGECDVVIFLCGEHTSKAKGVTAEMSITRELGTPYFLLWGRKNIQVEKPKNSLASDAIYEWKLENIKNLLLGRR